MNWKVVLSMISLPLEDTEEEGEQARRHEGAALTLAGRDSKACSEASARVLVRGTPSDLTFSMTKSVLEGCVRPDTLNWIKVYNYRHLLSEKRISRLVQAAMSTKQG
jgi:hypothetical protein